MILNLHGFHGQGQNSKYDWLKVNRPEREIHAPNFDYAKMAPDDILTSLIAWINSNVQKYPHLSILASSLGGFFGRAINILYPKLNTILINPCLAPFITLRGQLNDRAYFAFLAQFAFQDDHLTPEESRLRVLIGDQDELIDHARLTRPFLPLNFPGFDVVKGGAHLLPLVGEADRLLNSILS
jgi:predicted esterase YcpF (UPF0227 family)